ncbi:hypothetical protein I3843_Q000400 [Carya illinoinensis]|uniref:Uncharacterized protein n=1 Tax=Carya illinoinensis TaxID=32201 RepID=A0A922EFB5_CARIL|nr:hypothetical protein I3843_Q000400 [Carya illinoinensis]KAG6701096.1 hypothetical protein I3842_08G147700 [Carya illinoinensis]
MSKSTLKPVHFTNTTHHDVANPVWSPHHGFAPLSLRSISPVDASFSIRFLPPCFPLISHSTPRLSSQTHFPPISHSRSPRSRLLLVSNLKLISLPSCLSILEPALPLSLLLSLTSLSLPFSSRLSLTPICYLKTYTTSNASRFCLHPVMFSLRSWRDCSSKA